MTNIRGSHTRRQKSITGFKDRDGRWYDDDKLFSLQLTEEQELKFFEDFHKDAMTNSPTTAWGRERRRADDQDLMIRGERTTMDENASELVDAKWFDRINHQIDVERGRSTSDDIMPGVIRTKFGYQCSKFVPEEGVIRRHFLEQTAAVDWMNRINAFYNRKAR